MAAGTQILAALGAAVTTAIHPCAGHAIVARDVAAVWATVAGQM